MAKLTLDIKAHSVGDFSLVLSEYEGGDAGIILTQPFANAAEVREEFSKLEQLIAKAKIKALKAVDPAEQGVKAAQDVFAKVLKKADPNISKKRS